MLRPNKRLSERKGVYPARIIATSNDGEITVAVCNPTEEYVILGQKDVIGHLERVDVHTYNFTQEK
ncbi:MAG: hypothetical protein GY696_23565 [Gammaproteobacteria bacterium]|nr:hypothetical protein [Gammaproteobacteria bacterium]